MCNLYSLTKGQAAILAMARAMVDRTGNLPPLPGIYPDAQAPIIRNGVEGRELVLARWGMPSPAFALRGRSTDPGITNVRNVSLPHWRRWLGEGSRCLVPFTSRLHTVRRKGNGNVLLDALEGCQRLSHHLVHVVVAVSARRPTKNTSGRAAASAS